MAEPQVVFHETLGALAHCLCVDPPQTHEDCAELLQAAVSWAAAGPSPEIEQRVPKRAVLVAMAFAKLLETVGAAVRPARASTWCGTRAGTAEEEEEHCPNCCGPGRVLESDLILRTLSSESSNGSEQTDSSDDEQSSHDSCEECECLFQPQHFMFYAAGPMLILCVTHCQEWPWTDKVSRTHAKLLLASLLKHFNCTTTRELLRGLPGDEPTYWLFKEVLEILSRRLLKSTWESSPDAKVVFSWMLHQVSRPDLSEFLRYVMPPSLLFSDDYRTENKVLGITCLHYIIMNVPAAELRQFNQALVIYHALRNHLYTTETAVIEKALPCLLDLLPVLHKAPPGIGEYQKESENYTDQIMQLVLTNMEMEHRMDLRRLYARHLPKLQDRLQFRVIRHMKRLVCVIVGYLEVYDGLEETSRLCILETLQGTIKYAWPRIPCRLPLLLKALLKLIYEVTCESTPIPESVIEALLRGTTDCLLLLNRCCKGQVKTALKGIPSLCNEPKLVNYLKSLQNST